MNWFKDLFATNKPQDNTAFIITNDGNITLTRNGKTHSIGKTHTNYGQIVQVLNGDTKGFNKLDSLLDVTAKISRDSAGKVTVNEYGDVLHNGVPIHNVIAKRITEFAQKGLPYKPLMRFLDNLMENPSQRAVNELYTFLDHVGLAITADGHFIAYKGLRSDFKDIHSGKFDNSVGAIHEMTRNSVNDNAQVACSYGFHVGTHRYASGFAQGQLVLVKVNPRDAVSVPLDENCEKLRVCRYEVIGMCERLIEEPVYVSSTKGDLPSNTDDAYQAGALCYESGGVGLENPYMDDNENQHLYDAWDNGFEEAMEAEGDEADLPTAEQLEDAYAEGHQAFYDNSEDNPYKQDSERWDHWEGGWADAHEEAMTMEEPEDATGRRRGPGGKFLPS